MGPCLTNMPSRTAQPFPLPRVEDLQKHLLAALSRA